MIRQAAPDVVQTDYGRIFRHPNGIVYIYMADEVQLDINGAKQIVLDVRRLDNSGHAHLMVVQGVHNELDFAAQHYLGTVRGATHLALVVRSKLQADLGQFFLSTIQLFHCPYEMRVFHLLQQAEEWLLSSIERKPPDF